MSVSYGRGSASWPSAPRFLHVVLFLAFFVSALAVPIESLQPVSKNQLRSELLRRRAAEEQTRSTADDAHPKIDSVAAAAPYVKAPPRNKGMLWSGIQFDKAQAFSKSNGYQTLEQSVGPEILNHPEAHDAVKWDAFWAYLSQAFADKVVQSSSEVTIVLRAPNKKLTGPSDPLKDGRLYAKSDAGKIEIPTMKKHNIKIFAMHPDVTGAASKDRYELWPNDQGYKWQAKWKLNGSGAATTDDKTSKTKTGKTKTSTTATGTTKTKTKTGKATASKTKSKGKTA